MKYLWLCKISLGIEPEVVHGPYEQDRIRGRKACQKELERYVTQDPAYDEENDVMFTCTGTATGPNFRTFSRGYMENLRSRCHVGSHAGNRAVSRAAEGRGR